MGVAIAGAVRQRPMRHVRRERSGHDVRDAFAFASRHFGSVVRPPLLGRHSGGSRICWDWNFVCIQHHRNHRVIADDPGQLDHSAGAPASHHRRVHRPVDPSGLLQQAGKLVNLGFCVVRERRLLA